MECESEDLSNLRKGNFDPFQIKRKKEGQEMRSLPLLPLIKDQEKGFDQAAASCLTQCSFGHECMCVGCRRRSATSVRDDKDAGHDCERKRVCRKLAQQEMMSCRKASLPTPVSESMNTGKETASAALVCSHTVPASLS